MHAYVRFTHPLTGHERIVSFPTVHIKRTGVTKEKLEFKVSKGNRRSRVARWVVFTEGHQKRR